MTGGPDDTPDFHAVFLRHRSRYGHFHSAESRVIGVVYIIVRVLGKMVGAFIGGKLSHAEAVVQKYLGIGLIPQAGVAIGLAMMCGSVVPQYANEIYGSRSYGGTIIYELIGPVLTKFYVW